MFPVLKLDELLMGMSGYENGAFEYKVLVGANSHQFIV